MKYIKLFENFNTSETPDAAFDARPPDADFWSCINTTEQDQKDICWNMMLHHNSLAYKHEKNLDYVKTKDDFYGIIEKRAALGFDRAFKANEEYLRDAIRHYHSKEEIVPVPNEPYRSKFSGGDEVKMLNFRIKYMEDNRELLINRLKDILEKEGLEELGENRFK